MASGIARRHEHTTKIMAAKLCKMAAILQPIDRQRQAAMVTYRTSMLWLINTCQNRVSADQYHVIILQAQVYSSSRSHVFFIS